MTDTIRECNTCLETKAIARFHLNAAAPGGHSPRCIACTTYAKAKANHGETWISELMRKWKPVRLDDYDGL